MFARCFCTRRRERYDISCNNLTQVPTEVWRNRNTLVELILDSNHLNQLGKDVYSCSKLQRLYVCNNNLSSLPHEIGTLTNLIELNLSHNEIDEISDDIRRCVFLRFLDISNNNIRTIPDGVLELTSLEVLNVNECSLNEIPAEIQALKNLKSFEARDNLIDQVPDSIGHLISLSRLDLGCNEISQLTPEISKLTNLSELWLDTNILNSIPNDIGNLKSLTMLELSNNPIKVVPDSLCELENLKELSLTSNQITCLPIAIGKLTKLENLKLDFNRITDLPRSIGCLENLIELSLLGNQLTSLPDTIGHLKKLICIYADGNKISSLPDEICDCFKLNILSIRDNCLMQLPNDFGNLANMGVMELRGNRIQFLPKSLSNLSGLRCLWLSNTQQRPLYELQLEHHPKHGEILTCFLLPQKQKKGIGELNPNSKKQDINRNPETDLSNLNFRIPHRNKHSTIVENADLSRAITESGVRISESKPESSSRNTSDLSNSSNLAETRLMDSDLVNNFDILSAERKASFTDIYEDTGMPVLENTHKHDKSCKKKFFETEAVEFSFESGQRGFGICGGIDRISHVFGNSESSILVSNIDDSEIMRESNLRVGDRIISINGITMSLISNAEAERLLDLHENLLKLLIRHDPPPDAFEIVNLIREDTSEKFGISLTDNSEAPSRCSPLIVANISETGIVYPTGKVRKGMWLIEVNNEFLICYTREKAVQLLANLTGFVKLVFYNPEYSQSKLSEIEKKEQLSDLGEHENATENSTTEVQE